MTTPMHSPGPRGSLDDGSLAELVQDSREVQVDLSLRRLSVASDSGPDDAPSNNPIDVPEGASALIDGLAGYGS